ncbi:DUF2178 domain-containing protein [Candidatus Bathyarchaeota archaeon]|nr:DUF2178 domain-containing protein [Candidatus Bathyarchaeota archaeon]
MTNLPLSGVGMGILATIVIIGVFVIWKMLKELRSGFPLKDERTQRVSGRAAYYAFYLGTYFMLAMMFGNILSRELRGVYLLDGWYALIIAVVAQSLMFEGFRFYLGRKEDFQ